MKKSQIKSCFLGFVLLVLLNYLPGFVRAVDAQVYQIQIVLAAQGFDVGRIDGVYGVRTSEALKALQRKNNIPQSGIVDFDTRRLIQTLTTGSDPFREIATKDILWIKENMVGFDSHENMYSALTRESMLINHLLMEKVLILKLEAKKNKVVENSKLLTISEIERSLIANAVKSIELETYWDDYAEYNIRTQYKFLDYECSTDCSGHIAGYEWAAVNAASHSADCSNHSESFKRGCNLYVNGQ